MIKIYSSPSLSNDLDLTDAKSMVAGFNRRNFQPEIRQLWFRNDDVTKWISNISIYATSTTIDIYSGVNGFGTKFYYGELEPTERVWSATPYNQPINIANIGTSLAPDTSFKAFWMRLEVSPYIDAATYKATLQADYVEHPV